MANMVPARSSLLKTEAEQFASVVGIGASAGGLLAFGQLLDGLPENTGLAFVLIQHLDPSHISMMADLLAVRTKMPVVEASDGMAVEPDHVYVGPPGSFLSIAGGIFRLTLPKASRHVRLPIDFFLSSLAIEYGDAAVAVILSGNGDDGSAGLEAVAAQGGLVFVQEPNEAASNAMPLGAIATGLVDHVLPVEQIAMALRYGACDASPDYGDEDPAPTRSSGVDAIIALLGSEVSFGFSDYKPGTLQRRIERRMSRVGTSDALDYLARLRVDREELDALAADMFINVTGFFRDAAAFHRLAQDALPDLLRTKTGPKALRIWAAGCSTGEEAYSLAILCLEAISSARPYGKVQVFASDIDPDAVHTAREGLYPRSIAADVSAERLARFFVEEDGGFRVSAELRGVIVFTVHDLLKDPPFLQMDLIACRNLLIYLRKEAQHAALLQLDFALDEGGLLFLGASETVGSLNDRFKALDDKLRLYRHAGAIRVGPNARASAALRSVDGERRRDRQMRSPARPDLGDSARAFILETFAPAAVLIDAKRQVLYALGPIDRFLRLATGQADNDILAMARDGLRRRMRTAIATAVSEARLVSVVAPFSSQGLAITLDLSVRPMTHEGVEHYLVGFAELPNPLPQHAIGHGSSIDASHRQAGEGEMEADRRHLEAALHDIERLEGEREASAKEAMSVAEEYQATNEELVTSREEMQSLNEELTVVNGQLQGSLERQRVLAGDLQNILTSADVATLFLDEELRIRFFTPQAKSIVRIKDGDVGRPLADLTLLVDDPKLLAAAAAVTVTDEATEVEIEGPDGRCYMRRILPYASKGGRGHGVVLTFSDVTNLKAAGHAVEDARAYADAVIDTAPLPLVVLDSAMRAVSANRAFYRTYAGVTDARLGHFEPPNVQLSNMPLLSVLVRQMHDIAVPVEHHAIVLDTARGRRNLLLTANRIDGVPPGDEKTLVLIEDVTERLSVKGALRLAKAEAETATAEKSRFLAAASHDLRQPLQTLSLLHGLLAKAISDPVALKLVGRLNDTLAAMSDILDTLLDINQLEAGVLRPHRVTFPVDFLLSRISEEYALQANASGLRLRIVESRGVLYSDPRLLVQMVRNIVSNAIKYTNRGGIVVGCRHGDNVVRIEVWDSGIGIAPGQLGAVFDEFTQVNNPARERSKGLGLGLAIVQRLGVLLDHRVEVRSRAGRGSVFSIEVPLGKPEASSGERRRPNAVRPALASVLLVEDDDNLRDLLRLLLEGEGYVVRDCRDGLEALRVVEDGTIDPALVIADLNLPNGLGGLELLAAVRSRLGRPLPAIVLTGDVSSKTKTTVDVAEAILLTKPVKAEALIEIVHRLAAGDAQSAGDVLPVASSANVEGAPTISVIDDDPEIRRAMKDVLQAEGMHVATFASGQAFLDAHSSAALGCLLVDAFMPDMGGLDLMRMLASRGHAIPTIVITGYGDVATAVAAMKAGAVDFIEKPVQNADLLAVIARALAANCDGPKRDAAHSGADILSRLTARQRQILDLVLEGHPSKVIAYELGLSQRTVENHRASIMRRTESKSLPMLIRAVSAVL